MKKIMALFRAVDLAADYAVAYAIAGLLWLCGLGMWCTGAGSRGGVRARLHGLFCNCGGDDGFQE